MAIRVFSLDFNLALHNSVTLTLSLLLSFHLPLSPSPLLSCLEATGPHVSEMDSISQSQLC